MEKHSVKSWRKRLTDQKISKFLRADRNMEVNSGEAKGRAETVEKNVKSVLLYGYDT